MTGTIIGWAPTAAGNGTATGYRLAFGVIALCLLVGLVAYCRLSRR
jgi:hypothetical protein